MADRCAECGAPLDGGAPCLDLFHAILALEWSIPGGPGELSHFYAVASYGLQHPKGMNYTAETVEGLRSAVADSLEGRASLAMIRERARGAAHAVGRVTRREGDAEVIREGETWPMTVADLLPTPPEREAYAERVESWARSIVRTLDRHAPRGQAAGVTSPR